MKKKERKSETAFPPFFAYSKKVLINHAANPGRAHRKCEGVSNAQ